MSFVDIPVRTTSDLNSTADINQLMENINYLKGLLQNIEEYADNATAKANGLIDGDYYRTGDVLKVVHS